MPVIIDNVLIAFYQTQYNKIFSMQTPMSFLNPLSQWVDKRSALKDLQVVEELNAILSSVRTRDGREIAKPIDIKRYTKKIESVSHSMNYSPRGIRFVIDHRQELSEVLSDLNTEYHEKRGRIMRYLEKKISDLRPVVHG